MTKEYREITEELAKIEETRAGLAPLAETAEDAEIEARETELTCIEKRTAELLKRKAEIEAEERAAEEFKKDAATEEITKREDKKAMTNEEIRATHEYNVAYAEYLKTGKDSEVRALLTDTVGDTGTVPVPTMVQDAIETAYANTQIFSKIRKVSVKGVLKVPYEEEATGATMHVEGAAAPAEETLTIGTVEITLANIKKWLTYSDEVNAMKGEAFLSYVNAEIAQRIAEEADNYAVRVIKSSDLAEKYTVAAGAKTFEVISAALGKLADTATAPVVIMTKAAFFAAMAETGTDGHPIYNVIAENGKPAYQINGCPVIFNSNATDPIVGDLSGLLANLPEGEEIKYIVDPYSLAERDLIKVVGRLYVGIEVVRPSFFAVKG